MHRLTKLAVMVLLPALVSSGAAAGDVDPAYHAQVDADIKWPEIDDATRKMGVFVPAANVVKIAPGMTKKQIYTLLDVPHFSEGLFGVKKWNYILNFHTGVGSEYVNCQYQIRFDHDYRIETTYWETQQCADLVTKLVAVPAPRTVEKLVYVDRPVASTPAPGRLPKSFVVTFDSGAANIDSGDRQTIDAALAAAQASGSLKVTVVGHTDTVGSENSNKKLRERRATNVGRTLRNLAVERGYSLDVITSVSSALAISTHDEISEVSNRRVTIYIH